MDIFVIKDKLPVWSSTSYLVCWFRRLFASIWLGPEHNLGDRNKLLQGHFGNEMVKLSHTSDTNTVHVTAGTLYPVLWRLRNVQLPRDCNRPELDWDWPLSGTFRPFGPIFCQSSEIISAKSWELSDRTPAVLVIFLSGEHGWNTIKLKMCSSSILSTGLVKKNLI